MCEAESCNKMAEIENLQVHHIDHNTANNELTNLKIYHQVCNNYENAHWKLHQASLGDASFMQRYVCEKREAARPNERTATAEAAIWQSKEGLKHDTQRSAWNRWIRDRENGPFKGVNTSLYIVALAEMAPWGVGRHIGLDGPLGSSVTYRRFINEDIRGGILTQDEDHLAKTIVYLNLEKIKQEQNGQ